MVTKAVLTDGSLALGLSMDTPPALGGPHVRRMPGERTVP